MAYSKEELLLELSRLGDEFDKVSRSVVDKHGTMNSTTLVNHFGSFNNAKREAALEVEPKGGQIDGGIRGPDYYEVVLENASCANCSLTDNACLHFHHVKEKKYNVSTMVSSNSNRSSLAIYDELKKTIPVCANCHARHHSNKSDVNINEYWPHDWPHPTEVNNDK